MSKRLYSRGKRTGQYKSVFERTLATNLKRRKVKFEYEPFTINYTLKKTYTPDFVLKKNGIIIEAKGYLSPQDRTKMRAVKEDNPELDIRFVFANSSNKLNRSSKTTYGDWAEKNGFPWADGVIPDKWIKEK